MHFTWKKCERTAIRPAIFQLFFEDELWREISLSIVLRESPFREIQKMRLSRSEVEGRILDLEQKGAFSFLLRQLAKRAMTEQDAKTLLMRHKVSSNVIYETITKAQEAGYISDQLMLESLSRKFLNQKKSVRDIKMKLKRRFGHEVEIVSSDIPVAELDEKNLEDLIRKKFLRELLQIKEDRTQLQRLIAKLCRRGYSYDLIRNVIVKIEHINIEE